MQGNVIQMMMMILAGRHPAADHVKTQLKVFNIQSLA